MIRTFFERISRGRTFVRRLPSEFSNTRLFVSPDAQLKYLKPNSEAFDKELLNVASEHIKKGNVVWDIGANVGVFTFAAASLTHSTGYVLAIEPDLWLANLIQRSARISQNKHLPVNILPVAISDKCGVETFLIANRGRASNVLESAGGRSQMGGVREKHLVPAFCLDDLLQASAKPDFIKIDVEGAEIAVLKSGEKVLAESRPVIYCEVGINDQKEVSKIFQAANYHYFDASLPRPIRFEEEQCAFNTLAYPAEKMSEYRPRR